MKAYATHSGEHYDVVIVGAGVCGIYQLYEALRLGLKALIVEAGGGPGGTWHWNRYPGCRFDSESYTYGYSFSKELLNEWNWKERYSPQPDNLKYLEFVVDRLQLRRHMRFSTRVTSARYDEAEDIWRIVTDNGQETVCRYFVLGLGLLSRPTMPRIPGIGDFKGPNFHTYHWPHESVTLSDKRVAVIGAGATAIQVIGAIAPVVESLTVFQRRPNWVAPLNNRRISEEEMAEIRSRYDEIFATCAVTPGGFEHVPDRRGFWDVTREERVKLWDELYRGSGFGIWLRNFREIFTDEKANAEFSAYMADRIRERVRDPRTAEKLIPRDHGFGVQRVPMETNYLEAYNQENVELVDISETPIERVTETGIRTTEREYQFDLIVYATGFDAVTGAYDQIHIEGRGGRTLKEKWKDGPQTYLGMMVHGFPNMLMPAGPQSGSASTNYPRGIELCVSWTTRLLEYMHGHGLNRVEATQEAEVAWVQHVRDMYSAMLMRKAKSWFTGYNSNVEGHEEGTTRYFVYNGGAPKFARQIERVAASGYDGITFGASAPPDAAAAVAAQMGKDHVANRACPAAGAMAITAPSCVAIDDSFANGGGSGRYQKKSKGMG